MPRTRSLAWSELKIGIVAAIAMGLAVMLIVAVAGAAGFSWQRYALKTKFADVKGLKSGAVVRVAGVEVGKVTDVVLTGAEVEVELEVKKGNEQRITTDSRASIGSLSLLGEPVIDITPATTGTPLKDGDYIPGGRTPGQLTDVAEGARQSLEQINAMLTDVRAGKGTIGKFFADDELYKEITAFVSAAEGVTTNIRNGRGTMGRLINDPVAYDRLSASLDHLQEVTRAIRAGEGSLGRLLKDEAFAKSLTSATANFDDVTGRLKRNDNTMGKLLTERELYDRFNSTTGRIDAVLADLQKAEGTFGQLLRNKELYENINAAASEMRGLIADIRKDPKKYLNVRVSIF
ncbi:MAG TPA: MlaD family protein [Vicinamibacterales bacterium]|jgi:phospholipid/cholesterol/gamma-HCH transport system substrate-binding protein